jgi:hypothetical protein
MIMVAIYRFSTGIIGVLLNSSTTRFPIHHEVYGNNKVQFSMITVMRHHPSTRTQAPLRIFQRVNRNGRRSIFRSCRTTHGLVFPVP